MYVEGIRNARRFMSALRGAARVKPVLLVKAWWVRALPLSRFASKRMMVF